MTPILARVRRAIKEAGISQAALERAGVASQSAISAWFTREDSEPSASALGRLAEVLGLNGHWLLTGQGERRAMGSGADAVFGAGFEAGLQRAEEMIRELRATSADASGAEERRARDERVQRRHRQVQAEKAQTAQPPRPAPRKKAQG